MNDSRLVLVQLGEGSINDLSSLLAVGISSETSQEFVVRNLIIIVFIEILEEVITLCLSQDNSSLLECPLKLLSVKSSSLVLVVSPEISSSGSKSMDSSLFQIISDFFENSNRRLSLNLENGVQIWSFSTSHSRHKSAKLIETQFSRSVRVVFVEEGLDLILLEHASEFVESLRELLDTDDSLVLDIEILESLSGSLSFVLLGISLLSDFLVED